MPDTPYRKKLIEVSLPLKEINEASIREKSIRHGHPSTLHLWWSRKPLATTRAVLFASLIDDPSEHPERFPDEAAQTKERTRLFEIIRRIIVWENSNKPTIMQEARQEIAAATKGKPPAALDPFAGGGSIPLEAQRLGLHTFARDLNPVAVLINKALIEFPYQFAGKPSVNPSAQAKSMKSATTGAHGLAEDVSYYGKWMRDEAERRIGNLYPKAQSGGAVIAWLWARTVPCPNPACRADAPLTTSWWLSKKKNHEAWVEPIIDQNSPKPRISFRVRIGGGAPAEGVINRNGGVCIACGGSISLNHIRAAGKAGHLGATLLAVVAESKNGREYLSPTSEHIRAATNIPPAWKPNQALPEQALGFSVQLYGPTTFGDLFTPRQLTALTTLSDLASEAAAHAESDARAAGLSPDEAQRYAQALLVYLAFTVDRSADRMSSLCSWDITRDTVSHTFTRQALPMVWDYAEANPFSASSGSFAGAVQWVQKVVAQSPCSAPAQAGQQNAMDDFADARNLLISTDPPYYDNIGYSDISDFFYVWLRRALQNVFPDLFATALTPKADELIASQFRFNGSKADANQFFEDGMVKAFTKLRAISSPEYPLTVYYAFKQSDMSGGRTPAATSDDEVDSYDEDAEMMEELPEEAKTGAKDHSQSTGWETMLEGLIRAGFTITGSWPIRTELQNRSRGINSNALASSIALVCRPRPESAPMATRRQLTSELNAELPKAVRTMQADGVAPVDIAQACIGPGMAIYSKYREVREANGDHLPVREALRLINVVYAETVHNQQTMFDVETRWALMWFETYGFNQGEYGKAETLFTANNTSLRAVTETGIAQSAAGKLWLTPLQELPTTRAARKTVWGLTHRMMNALRNGDGIAGAAAELSAALQLSEEARDLAYQLYAVCERKKWSAEGQQYNDLINSWREITKRASQDQPNQMHFN